MTAEELLRRGWPPQEPPAFFISGDEPYSFRPDGWKGGTDLNFYRRMGEEAARRGAKPIPLRSPLWEECHEAWMEGFESGDPGASGKEGGDVLDIE